jgi:hypothetical protein
VIQWLSPPSDQISISISILSPEHIIAFLVLPEELLLTSKQSIGVTDRHSAYKSYKTSLSPMLCCLQPIVLSLICSAERGDGL